MCAQPSVGLELKAGVCLQTGFASRAGLAQFLERVDPWFGRLFTGGADVRNATPGVQAQVVLKSGGAEPHGGGRFYFLAPGDRYNLKTRDAERPQQRGAPIERVVKEPWTK